MKKKPELIIGIVAKIGTDLESINEVFSEELIEYGYAVIPIKVTESLKTEPVRSLVGTKVISSPREDRYSTSMDACNKLREMCENDVMSKIAITQISSIRGEVGKKDESAAYLIRQLKRKEEVDCLRNVYGDRFILVSCYSPRSTRCSFLANDIGEGHSDNNPNKWREKAEHLIERDEDEAEVSDVDAALSGQKVAEVFPMADVIIDTSTRQKTKDTISNFLKVFFGNPSIAPKPDEYGSYMASSAALRSSDLSRQVGAAIFTENLEIIALGANEVPKFQGGTYLEGEEIDGRDAAIGKDANHEIKIRMVRDAISKISSFLKVEKSDAEINSIIKQDLFSEGSKLKKLMILDLTEFGRAVHAEMNAITDAARLGRSTKNSTLYCTTFPCHNCAKHIVASGITRVVYLQPYPKSQAERLYPDSIQIDPDGSLQGKVLFEIHNGIGPNLYKRVFSKSKKKDKKTGKMLPWNKLNAVPCVNATNVGYRDNEKVMIALLNGSLEKAKAL